MGTVSKLSPACKTVSDMQKPVRQSSCPSISQLSPFRQRQNTNHLHFSSLELHLEDGGDQHQPPTHLPLYRTVSAGTVHTRRSAELTNSMTGVLEEMKEIKKENFELKLKLFFLEERLGISVGGDSMKNLSDENVELKIQLQQCKIDIEKKSNLIKEAIDAIDICEKKITLLEEVNSDLWEKNGKTDEIKEVRNIFSQTMSFDADSEFFLEDEYEEFSDEMLIFAEALGSENIFHQSQKEIEEEKCKLEHIVDDNKASEKVKVENDDSDMIKPGMVDSFLSKRFLLRTGFCVLGALFVGLNIFHKLNCDEQFEDAITMSSYI